MKPLLTAGFQSEEALQLDIEKQNLAEVDQTLKKAVQWLNKAECVMSGNSLDSRYSTLYQGIVDAIHGANHALNHVNDVPDEDSPGAIIHFEWESLLEAVNADNSEV
jgi:hypothetical protein